MALPGLDFEMGLCLLVQCFGYSGLDVPSRYACMGLGGFGLEKNASLLPSPARSIHSLDPDLLSSQLGENIGLHLSVSVIAVYVSTKNKNLSKFMCMDNCLRILCEAEMVYLSVVTTVETVGELKGQEAVYCYLVYRSKPLISEIT